MIDPKQVQALTAVVREGSFQAAARSLSLTPAAITQRVKSLETAIGARVLVRGKILRLTPQGQAILGYSQKAEWLEQDLMRSLNLDSQQFRGKTRWRTLRVAINADSVATWFLPGVKAVLLHQHLLLDVIIDDQDYTHEALRSGEVVGCITTLAQSMKGCLSEPLGIMRYRCLAQANVIQRATSDNGKLSIHRLLGEPAIIFNRKDALHDRFLLEHFGLEGANYPKHFVPALDAFEAAITLGLGWGMVADASGQSLGDQVINRPNRFGLDVHDVMPGAFVDVALYWQHWEQEPAHAASLTRAVKAAANQALIRVTD
jgi:LysR family transcriptional regulator (chromosome initiation inhibitor)